MEYHFGSDEFFFLLKSAYEEEDTDTIGELLWPMVCKASHQLFKKECFWGYSPGDKEDAQQDAMLYVLKKIESFLLNPRNNPFAPEDIRYSPRQKEKLFYQLVEYGLLHSYRDIYKGPETISIDEYRNKENSRTFEQTLVVPDKWSPEACLEARDSLEKALYSFFSLPNNPETLASIGFVIISEQMSNRSMSLEEYANLLNGKSVNMIVAKIETLLKPLRLHFDVLSPLKKRLESQSNLHQFISLTPSKLANRKNSILSKLSMKLKDNEPVLRNYETERGNKPDE